MGDKNKKIAQLTNNKNHSQKLKEKRQDKRFCDSLYLVIGHIMSFRSSKFILAAVLLGVQFLLFFWTTRSTFPITRKL